MSLGADSSASLRLRTWTEPPPQWENLLEADGGADFFHTLTWTRAAAAAYPELSPLWVTAELQEPGQESGEMVGGLVGVRRSSRVLLLGSSAHFLSHLDGTSGGPLVAAHLPAWQQERVFGALVDRALTLRQGLLCSCGLSLNTDHERRFGTFLAGDPRFRRRQVPAAVIDLSGGPEKVEMERFAKNKRNERNRGLRRGAEILVTRDREYVRRYYPIYVQATSTWGIDPVPLAFLEQLLEDPEERVFFTCVLVDGRVAGGHLNLQFGTQVMAWNGVTDPDLARSHFPATVAVWGDVVEACRRSAVKLDLGASGGVVSLAGFKKHFGATMENRGFYLNESGGLRVARRVQRWVARWRVFLGPEQSRRRWHDAGAGDANPEASR